MDNCLVTKLKGIVNDDALLKLGELRVKFLKTSIQTTGANGDNLVINETSPYTLSLKGGHFNASPQIGQGATEVTIPSGVAVIGVDTIGATMSVLQKYGITRWEERAATESDPMLEPWDIDFLKYAENLTHILTNSAFGDIAKLPKNNYTKFHFNFSGVYGNVKEALEGATGNNIDLNVRSCAGIVGDVKDLQMCVRFVADKSGLSGSLEKWVEARMALGLTSVRIRHNIGGSNIKFINQSIAEGTFLWTSYSANSAEIALGQSAAAWVTYTGGVWYDHNGNPYTPQ